MVGKDEMSVAGVDVGVEVVDEVPDD